MVLAINNLTGFGGGKTYGAPISYSYLQTATSSVDGSSYTFSSQNLGTASTDRVIVAAINFVGIGTLSFPNPTNITIAGVSATFDGNYQNANNDAISWICYANVPTGTTGDVVITLSSGNSSACSLSLYALYNPTGIVNYSPISRYSGAPANPVSFFADIPAGGVMIAAGCSSDTVDGMTWTGVTENVDGSWATENYNYTAASRSSTSPVTHENVQMLSNSSTIQSALALVFAPKIQASEIPIIMYTAYGIDNTNRTTSYTFSALNIGHAAVDRIVQVTAHNQSAGVSAGFSSCTIGGNAATAIHTTYTTANDMCMSAFYLAVPAGTTADIVVTVNGGVSVNGCILFVCAIYGSSGAPSAYNVSAATATSNSNTLTMTRPGAVFGLNLSNGTVTSISDPITNMTADLYGAFINDEGLEAFVSRSVYKSSTFTSVVSYTASTQNLTTLIAW